VSSNILYYGGSGAIRTRVQSISYFKSFTGIAYFSK